MLNNFIKGSAILLAVVFVSGCTMHSYVQEKGRVDQEMTGNAGCIQGTCPPVDRSNLSKTRKTYVLEIDTGYVKTGNSEDQSVATTTKSEARSFYEDSSYYEKDEARVAPAKKYNYGIVTEAPSVEATKPSVVEYTIEKDDTLQKISQKFYGTVKRWNEIYEANKDVLKDPNRIKPGKKICIPQK